MSRKTIEYAQQRHPGPSWMALLGVAQWMPLLRAGANSYIMKRKAKPKMEEKCNEEKGARS